VLVGREPVSIESLAGGRVAVADISTTGGVLARMYCPPDVELVARPYHRIADAVLTGEVDAGVMIHEELVHFPELGLHRVLDLGAAWQDETGLPLPVGLNLVRRSLGLDAARRIVRVCRASLSWAMAHPEAAMAAANRFGRGRAADFVPMFSNEDTLRFPPDVRAGLELLLSRVAAFGLGPAMSPADLEIVDV
jgi:1,4-dihydroxy-6-naphthoate synthase